MAQLTEKQQQAIEAALFAGNKIEAIKLHREATGLGLAEAKQAVEKMEADLRQIQPDKFAKPAGKKGCFGPVLSAAAIVLLALMAMLVWN